MKPASSQNQGPIGGATPPGGVVRYPDSDGQPMADNTEQFEFIQTVQGNLDALLDDFVAGDHLWYPVEGAPGVRVAPDVYVARGRPKGHRGSYKQWEEDGVPLTVVFEWWSPNSSFPEQVKKLQFYERYGVQEFYTWDQVRHQFAAFVRVGEALAPRDTADGFQSPLLGVRFEVRDDQLEILTPEGEPFKTFRELKASAEQAEQARVTAEQARVTAEQARVTAEQATAAAEARAAELEARLRAAGIDPNG